MNCILKNFILKKLNKLLDEYKDNVGKARGNVNLWLSRAESLTNCLKGLSQKLDDNKLTEDELEQAIEEVKTLIEGWK